MSRNDKKLNKATHLLNSSSLEMCECVCSLHDGNLMKKKTRNISMFWCFGLSSSLFWLLLVIAVILFHFCFDIICHAHRNGNGCCESDNGLPNALLLFKIQVYAWKASVELRHLDEKMLKNNVKRWLNRYRSGGQESWLKTSGSIEIKTKQRYRDLWNFNYRSTEFISHRMFF